MKPRLSNVVAQLREELIRLDAERRAEEQDAVFQLGELEIELQFLVEESDAVKGGFDLKVVTFGSDDTYSKQTIQRVKLTLVPVTEGAAPLGTRFRKDRPLTRSPDDVERL